jgi:7-keto-8-aminopelargonate synthetase-like enzyme
VEGIPALNYSGPPSNLHAAVCLRHLAQWDDLAEHRRRIRYASQRLHAFCAHHQVMTRSPAGSPILAVAVHDDDADQAAAVIHAEGILCKPAIYPVVRRGDEVLRFTLTAAHTDAQLAHLERALRQACGLLRRTA